MPLLCRNLISSGPRRSDSIEAFDVARAIVKGYKALQLTGRYIGTIIIRRPDCIQLTKQKSPLLI